MNDEVASPGTDKSRWTESLRPYAKPGTWTVGALLTVAGALSLYLLFLRPEGPPLTVMGGNPVSVGEWPCGKQIATGIALRNDSGHDLILDRMDVY
jgi:hypothetical protein